MSKLGYLIALALLTSLLPILSYANEKTQLEEVATLGEPGFRLTGPIEGLTFSPSGDVLAGWSNGANGSFASLRLWQLPSGKELFRTSDRRFSYAKFSSDGKRLLAGDLGTLAVFDVNNKTSLFSLNTIHTTQYLVCLSDNGERLYVGHELEGEPKQIELRCYTLSSAEMVFQNVYPHEQCCAIAIKPQSDELAVLGSSSLRFINSINGKELAPAIKLELKKVGYSSLRPICLFSPSGKYLFCADRPDDGNKSGLALIYDSHHRSLLQALSEPASCYSACFSSDEKELIASTTKGIKCFALHSGDEHWIWTNKGDGSSQSRVRNYSYRNYDWPVFAHNLSKGLLIEGNEKQPDALLTKLSLRNGKVLKQKALHSFGRLRSIAISPKGRYAALGGDHNMVRVIDLINNEPIILPDGHSRCVSAIAIAPKNDYAFTGSKDGTLRLWELKTRGHVGRVGRHQGKVVALAFSPNGKELASVDSKGMLRRFTVPEMKSLGTAKIEESISSAKFIPRAGLLGVAQEKGEVVIYRDLFDGHHHSNLKIRRRFCREKQYKIKNLCMCLAGMTVTAVGEKGPVFVWRPKDGWVLTMLEWTRGRRHCALSPSGLTLACSSRSAYLFMADPHTGRMLFACPAIVEATVMHFFSNEKLLCVGAAGKATILTLKRYPKRRFTKALELVHKETLHLDIPAPSSISSSTDGKHIAFGLCDTTAAIYKIVKQ